MHTFYETRMKVIGNSEGDGVGKVFKGKCEA